MVIYSVFCSLFTIYHAKKEYKQHQKNYKFVICCKQKNHSTMPFSIPHGKKLDHTLARKNDSSTWCDVILVMWSYCVVVSRTHNNRAQTDPAPLIDCACRFSDSSQTRRQLICWHCCLMFFQYPFCWLKDSTCNLPHASSALQKWWCGLIMVVF